MARIVLDTNVLIAGLLWRGTPGRLLEMARDGAVMLATSVVLLDELAEVLKRQKFAAMLARVDAAAMDLVDEMRALAEVFEAPPLAVPVCRDPDDDAVLAVALAADAELIVTGDADLLALGSYAGVDIVKPAEAVARVGQAAHG